MLNKHADPSHPSHRAQSSFWRLLTGFWAEDRVAKWRKKIFPNPDHPDTGVDVCFNLISLSPSAHWYWNKGHFALKPLEMRRNLPFNSSGNLNTAMEAEILLIYSRNHYHQRI